MSAKYDCHAFIQSRMQDFLSMIPYYRKSVLQSGRFGTSVLFCVKSELVPHVKLDKAGKVESVVITLPSSLPNTAISFSAILRSFCCLHEGEIIKYFVSGGNVCKQYLDI